MQAAASLAETRRKAAVSRAAGFVGAGVGGPVAPEALG